MVTVLLTRPTAQAAAFADALRADGDEPLQIVISPLLAIRPLSLDWTGADAVVLTSAHGVAAAQRLGVPVGIPAWCVGGRTANLARQAGYHAIVGPGDAARLLAQIIAARPDGKLAHIRGRHTRGDIARNLTLAGIACDELMAYDQIAQPLSAQAQKILQQTDPVICPLFSPRTAELFAAAGPHNAPVHPIVLSLAVKAALPKALQDQAIKAKAPDGNAMQAAVLGCIRDLMNR